MCRHEKDRGPGGMPFNVFCTVSGFSVNLILVLRKMPTSFVYTINFRVIFMYIFVFGKKIKYFLKPDLISATLNFNSNSIFDSA